jgi:quercetin dioxygenase-like cupin family protein
MFKKHSREDYIKALPGVNRKTLVYGAKTLMTEFFLEEGNSIPVHSHPYEQTGYLVTGKLRFTIGSEIIDAKPGDSWCIPSDEMHGAEVLENSTVIEIFSPVREDYLP